jgi:hypothetical protein
MSVDQMSVVRMSDGRISVGKMSVGHIVFDQKMRNRQCLLLSNFNPIFVLKQKKTLITRICSKMIETLKETIIDDSIFLDDKRILFLEMTGFCRIFTVQEKMN